MTRSRKRFCSWSVVSGWWSVVSVEILLLVFLLLFVIEPRATSLCAACLSKDSWKVYPMDDI